MDELRAPAVSTPALAAALRAIQAGRYDDVAALVRDALKVESTAAPAHELLGIALAMQGRLEQARSEFHAALRADPKQVTALIKLGDLDSAQGRFEEADRHYERARQVDDSDPQLAQRLGLSAERKGDLRGAIAWYEKGIRDAPADYLGVRLNLAGLYNRSGQPARTVALLEDHPKRASSAGLLFHLGVAHSQLRDYPAAIGPLRQALAIDPTFWNAALALGVAQRVSGSPVESVDTLRRLAPRSPLPPVELGHSLLAVNRPAEAIAEFEKGVALSNDRPVFRLELAQAYLAAGDHAKAIAQFDALSRVDGAPIEVGLGLATSHRQAGNLDEAGKVYERLRKLEPKNALVAYQAGLFEAFRRNYDAAIKLLGSASADPVLRPQAMRAMAFAYGQKGDHRRAVETARQLVKGSADEAGARLTLAVLLEQAGRNGEAAAEYEAVLERRRDELLALNNLAVLRSEAGRHDGALALAEKAHRLAPADPQVLDTYGWALHRAGRSRDALRHLTEAVRMAPHSSTARFHLGAVRMAVGERAAGRAELAAALQASPQAAWAAEARRLLDGG
ncbi:MAG TPA: tetratricopeptide repeat protein [Burkholderiaceae bacterium]|nr:tetratricopeptide repeat protein [Burkholderiaceae bacterium]